MKKYYLTLISVFLLSMAAFSQAPACGTDFIHKELMETDPVYNQKFLEQKEAWRQYKMEPQRRPYGTNDVQEVYEIPVVVHVIHTGDPLGSIFNPTDEDITAWIESSNSIYAADYPDYATVENGGTKIPIRLVLAKRDPDCNPTNGIVRKDGSSLPGYISNGVSSNDSPGTSVEAFTNLSRWNPSDYYNIWISRYIANPENSIAAGFAYLPPVSFEKDGTIIAAQYASPEYFYWGTLPHELAHSMGIRHTWEGSNGNICPPSTGDCTVDGDGICDTEPHVNLSGLCLEPSDVNSCTGNNYQGVQYNIMSYSQCPDRFTPGQREKMLFTLLKYRSSLLTSMALVPPGQMPPPEPAPIAATCVPTSIENPSNNLELGPVGVSLADMNVMSSAYSSAESNFYVDYTAPNCINNTPVAHLDSELNHTLKVSIKAGNNSQRVGVWIDFNNDGEFSADERILNAASSEGGEGTVYWSSSFDIPKLSVASTPLRMRVIADFNEGVELTPCMNPKYGQVEDYIVIISNADCPNMGSICTDENGDQGVLNADCECYVKPPCPPGNVMLGTQAEVNQFLVDYPNCTQISGYLSIGYNDGATDISDLSPLSNLVTIDGTLYIDHNPDLLNINGLNSITSLGETLYINKNASLSNLNGLSNLSTVGGQLEIKNNASLSNISGIQNTSFALTSGGLYIANNPALAVCNLPNICAYLAENRSATITGNLGTCYSIADVIEACTSTVNSGAALHFDGSDDYAEVTSPTHLPMGNAPRTIEAWIKTNRNDNNYYSIVNYGFTEIGQRFGILINKGKAYFVGQGVDLVGGTIIADNEWHHIAVTYEGGANGKVSIYVDGVLDASANKALNTTAGPIRIGRRVGPSSEYFSGTIDEIRIWDYALTACEIEGRMNGELNGSLSGLVTYYQFNQGIPAGYNTAITTLVDLTGNNDATLYNFALNGEASNFVEFGGVESGVNASEILDATISSHTNISCAGANNGALTVTATGDTGVYTYLWSNGATGASISDLAPGAYSVTVSGEYCEITLNATITEPIISNLAASNITVDSADLSWEISVSTDDDFEIQWGLEGFVLGTGTIQDNISNAFYTLSGLNSDTSYDFYVRQDCGGIASWVGPKSFTTDTGSGCEWTIRVWEPYYGDEVEWELTDADDNVVLSGGNYSGFGYDQTHTVTAEGPLTFFITSDTGGWNDNEPNYTVSNGNGIILLGQLSGGTDATYSDLECSDEPLLFCEGTPDGGIAVAALDEGHSGSSVNFTVSGYSESALGLSYEWEYSTDNGSTWAGTGNSVDDVNFTITGSAGTVFTFRYAVTCEESGLTGYSNEVTFTIVGLPDPCDNITVMDCGVEYSAALVPNSGHWNNYPDVGWILTGSEHVFEFTAPYTGNYTLTLDEGLRDADFILMDSCGNTGTNLTPGGAWEGYDWITGSPEEVTVELTEGVTYFLIADLYSSLGTTVTVSVTCLDLVVYDCPELEANFGDACGDGGIVTEDCECDEPVAASPCDDKVVMECGVEYTATLIPNSGHWSTYTGVNYGYTGSEQVWEFTAPETGDYTFEANEGVRDADFFLMDACSNTANNLSGYWDNGSKTFSLTGGVTYYLIADLYSFAGAQTTVTVKVNCPIPMEEGYACDLAIPLECDAEPITVNSTGSTATNEGACDGSGGPSGMWFTFEGTGGDITLRTYATFDHGVYVNYGECGSLTTVVCYDLPIGARQNKDYVIENSIAGMDYYVYIGYWTVNALTGDITVSIECGSVLWDCPDLEANIGDACTDGDGNEGTIDEDCNCSVDETLFITKWSHFANTTTSIQFDALTTGAVNYTWEAQPSGNSGAGSFTMTSAGTVTLTELNIPAGDELTISMEPDNLKRFYMEGYFSNRGNLIDVSQWGTAAWTSMETAFFDCDNLLEFSATDTPDLSNVTSMANMFLNANAFNGAISNWDVSSVSNMTYMFNNATAFNGDISNWDVSSVNDMYGMFGGATAFNGDISNWDVSSVSNMTYMFYSATSFNQNIGTWELNPSVIMSYMLYNSGLDCEHYSATLIGWNANNPTLGNRNIGSVSGMQYGTNAETARTALINRGWTISGDTASGTDCSPAGEYDCPDLEANIGDACTDADGNDGIIDEDCNCSVDKTLFITKWSHFASTRTSIQFDALTTGAVNYTWEAQPSGNSGSGSFTMTTAGSVTLTELNIPAGDELTISMEPDNLKRFYMEGYFSNRGNLIDVSQWGTAAWTSMEYAFYGCDNLLEFSATDTPDLSNVNNMTWMLRSATAFNGDISNWDVSSVNDMSYMFAFATAFNGDISNWDVSNVNDLSTMFYGATAFNGDISNWDVSSVDNMNTMFYGATAFNGDISNWDVSSVNNMVGMFGYATAFNGDISNWDVSSVDDMAGMFEGTTAFNGDISNWDVSSVDNMTMMFYGATAFNGDISNWDVSSVNNMANMFQDATAFNGDISNWDISSVIDMFSMFYGATSFNQNIGTWELNPNVEMGNMLANSGLDCEHYSATLIGWNANNPTLDNIFIGDLTGLQYGTNATTARQALVDRGWYFIGDAASGTDCSPAGEYDCPDLEANIGDACIDGDGNEGTIDEDCNCSVDKTLFITKWSHFGSTTTSIKFDALTSGAVNYTWEAQPSGNSGAGSFTMTSAGTVTLTGLNIPAGDELTISMEPDNLKRFYMEGYSLNRGNLIDVSQWGTAAWASMEYAFYGCTNLQGFSATDTPDLSNVNNMSIMFYGATAFNGDISNWDVSNVGNMSYVFNNATAFNGDISNWDVSGVNDMSIMFYGATAFNGDISNWDVSSVNNMDSMFSYATAFNGDISNWDVSSVNNMAYMFEGATAFNGDISNWDVSSVNNMAYMFYNAIAFNDDISNWDVSNVSNMSYMFNNATAFNGDISNWDVSSVNNMAYMFYGATAFNGDISNWDVSRVNNMAYMFYGATSFNQNIGAWELSPYVSMFYMLTNSGLDCEHYSATLIGWNVNNPTLGNRNLGSLTGMQYGTNAITARQALVNRGWYIVGDTASGTDCSLAGEYDCPDLEANIGDACTDADGNDGIIDEDCNCFIPPSPCDDIIVMECGVEYSAILLPNSGAWTNYTDVIYTYNGSEQVWAFTAPEDGDYIFSADEGARDADFFLMDSCGPLGNNLIGGYWDEGDRTITLTGGETYYLIADLWDSVSTTVTVKVTCPEVVLDGYVYEDGAWYPSHPSGASTNADNIWIMNGSASGNDALGNTDANNVTIMSGANLDVKGVLNVNGDLVIDGSLIFLSGEDYDGQLGLIAGDIIGEATVHRYFKPKRSYRMISSTVTTSTSIHNNWQEAATSNIDNPSPGFGTHITGTLIDQENGFDATQTGNSSMYIADVPNQQFVAVSNTDVDVLEAGTPYLLFVRGDRSIDLTENSSFSETVLRAKGALFTGPNTQNFPTVNAGQFAMFGNPYQSTVNINDVFSHSTNVNSGFYYIYDPSVGDYGGFVTVVLPQGTNTFTSESNEFLQPGQAAQFATLTNGASAINFIESDKSPGNFTSTNFNDSRLSSDHMLTIQLYTTENYFEGGLAHDALGIQFDSNFDNAITPSDAVKPMNIYENLAVQLGDTYLSIERREMPVMDEVYQLYTNGYSHADYTLRLMIEGLEDVTLYLEDNYTGTSTALDGVEETYSFSVDANDPISMATDRFSIRVGERSLGVNNNNLLTGISLFPNPINSDIFYINAPRLDGKNVNVSISDVLGRQVYASELDCIANRISVPFAENIASGVYTVTIRYLDEKHTLKLIKE